MSNPAKVVLGVVRVIISKFLPTQIRLSRLLNRRHFGCDADELAARQSSLSGTLRPSA